MAFYQQPNMQQQYQQQMQRAQQPQQMGAPGASKLYDIYRRRMNGFRRPQRPTVAQPQPYMAGPSYGVSKAPSMSMGPQPYAQPQPYNMQPQMQQQEGLFGQQMMLARR